MDLCTAAREGDLERVRLLVQQGVDKDTGMLDYNGRTPLIHACQNDHLDVVQYLVEQGAAMDKVSADGNWTPLANAAAHGHLEVVRFLLEQGADRDKADNVGNTPLHDAARLGQLETTKLLMVYGADLSARNREGRLPIEGGFFITEEIKQAIRDEPRRRMDHGHKRATEQDRHPNTATSASAQEELDEPGEQQSNKRPRLNEGEVAEEETKVAEEDEDSEPSSDEADD